MILRLKLEQHSQWILCACFALLITITLLYSSLAWRDDWQLTHAPIKNASTELLASRDQSAINALPKSHLFGQSTEKLGGAPLTNLQFGVTGISKVYPEQAGLASKAAITLAGQASKLYQVGDELPYGVKIYAITADAVILNNGGHLEKLPLARQPLLFKSRPRLE